MHIMLGGLSKKLKVVLVLFTFLGVILVQERVNYSYAQERISGSGISCIEDETDCSSLGADFENLEAIINSSDFEIFGELSRSSVINAIRNIDWSQRGSNALLSEVNVDARMCFNTSALSTQLFQYAGPTNYRTVVTRSFDPELRVGTKVYRACEIGYEVSYSDQVGALFDWGDFDTWGCCPSNGTDKYQFITLVSASTAGEATTNSACCLIPDGARPGGSGYPYGLDSSETQGPAQCVDRNSVPVWTYDPTYVGPVQMYYYQSITAPGSQSDSALNGKPFAFVDGTQMAAGPQIEGSAAKCQNTGGCAIVGEQVCDSTGVICEPISGVVAFGSDVYDQRGGIDIIDPILLNDNNFKFQCQTCFNQGEAIAIDNGVLLVCANNASGLVAEEPLVNGNISDTIACLNSGNGTASFAACSQCRERGGVWTALGCNDTTPLGILTGIMRIAYGVMGGVALIQLIIAGIAYQTGQEEQIKKARKQIIQTITGLVVLTFSVLILRIIGINILDIVPEGFFG